MTWLLKVLAYLTGRHPEDPAGVSFLEYLFRYPRRRRSGLGPHGGVMTRSGYEHLHCKHCKGVAVYPPNMPSYVQCTVPGHLVERDDDYRVVRDICPEVTS